MKNYETKMNIITAVLVICVIGTFIFGCYGKTGISWIFVSVAGIAVGSVMIPSIRQVVKDMKSMKDM